MMRFVKKRLIWSNQMFTSFSMTKNANIKRLMRIEIFFIFFFAWRNGKHINFITSVYFSLFAALHCFGLSFISNNFVFEMQILGYFDVGAILPLGFGEIFFVYLLIQLCALYSHAHIFFMYCVYHSVSVVVSIKVFLFLAKFVASILFQESILEWTKLFSLSYVSWHNNLPSSIPLNAMKWAEKKNEINRTNWRAFMRKRMKKKWDLYDRLLRHS